MMPSHGRSSQKAREIGADERRSAADKLMERLAKTKPEPRKAKG
jgi:hypothetical protein